MAGDERTPNDRASAPRSSGGSYSSGAPRKDGAPRSGGYKGGPRKDGEARSSGTGYKGGPRTGGDPRKTGGPHRDGQARPPRKERDGRDATPAKKGPPAPEIPEDIEYGQLDRSVRSRLRTLSKENAEDVGRHLIMAGNLLDSDPELAYQHAMVAAARGGRVDVVREAAAVTAYATGRYAEALREYRTVRRLSGSSEHLPAMADCERGLGRPERAIALSQEPEAATLDATGKIELAIVVAGARTDMGDNEAALVSLKRLNTTDAELRERIDEATAGVLRLLGRDDEADALEPTKASEELDDDEDIVVYDTVDEEEPEVQA